MKLGEEVRHLKTSEIAKLVGVHSNTVRLYEQWGFISPVPRAPNGYRLYAREHLDQMRLARLALHGGWPGKSIRESALSLVLCTASMDLRGALAQARKHLRLMRAERTRAEKAAALLERWAERRTPSRGKMIQIGEAAKKTGLSIDMLRSWERNGLIKARRDPQSGYRLYGAAEISRLRVIRMLRLAGYSTMAILRMMIQLDQGMQKNLRLALDTPRPDEDVYTAADRWLSTLAEQEKRAKRIVVLIQAMLQK
jgi:DNA-binding transcriptional MerR regulator